MEFEMPILNEALAEIGGNETLLEELLSKFRLWLQQQQHLPQDVSDQKLKYFICTAKFDFEKAKERLDMHYTLRHLISEMYGNLDPFSDDVNQFHKCTQWVILPKLSPKKYRISVCRLLDNDASLYEPWIMGRYAVLMLETCIEENIVDPFMMIVDCTGINIGHILKFTPMIIKKANSCLETYGTRLKKVYVINAPKVIDLFMTMIKSIVKTKLLNRIYICTSGIESLEEIIPKSVLPADYGGELPSMSTLTDMWRAKLAERRDWFLKQEKATANESLRSNSTINPNNLFGVSGTFRKLDID